MKSLLPLFALLAASPASDAQYREAPQLTITNPTPQNFDLVWQSKNQRPYFLEGSPDMHTWADAIATPVVGDGGTKGITLTNPAQKFFYRLREGAIRPGFDSLALNRNDDETYNFPLPVVKVPLGFSVNFYGETYSKCYVNNNGNITFDRSLSTWTPSPLGLVNSQMIAPFWADVDTLNVKSGLVRFTDPASPQTVDGHSAFGVSSRNVGYYDAAANRLNSFQVVLIERSDISSGDFDIEFNYNQIEWETGNVSGGVDGLGGNSARVGIANGDGLSFEYSGSGETLAFLDEHPLTGIPNYAKGLIYQSLNSSTPGRIILPIRNGTAPDGFSVNAGEDITLAESAGASFSLAGTVASGNTSGFLYNWVEYTKAPGVSINGANTLNPTVNISQPVTYFFRFTATKPGGFSIIASDTVRVIHPASYEVEAGFYEITEATTVLDQAYVISPTGVTVTVLWTQDSGAPATITNPTDIHPQISLPSQGDYTFKMTATTSQSSPFVFVSVASVHYQ